MIRFNNENRPAVEAFLHRYFPHVTSLEECPTQTPEEEALMQKGMAYVESRFSRAKYTLGLALDFTLLAQKLSALDPTAKAARPGLTIEEFRQRYARIVARGGRTANTLTVTYAGEQIGIRGIEEEVAVLFHGLDRSDYPSAYVYNTGQWHKFEDLLLDCARLGESARLEFCKRLIGFGLLTMPRNRFVTRATVRPRLFERIIEDYPRRGPDENAGLTFQAIAYGHTVASHPLLSIAADKVRTGSSRQRRFGDIDCYYGLDLELAVEVKDLILTPENLPHQLGEFQRNTAGNNIRGIAFVQGTEQAARETLASNNVLVITQAEALIQVAGWGWLQQDSAVQAALHYLAHIEQNPRAVYRLLEFIATVDPQHDCLAHRENYANSGSSVGNSDSVDEEA